jgi:hypothetical protein
MRSKSPHCFAAQVLLKAQHMPRKDLRRSASTPTDADVFDISAPHVQYKPYLSHAGANNGSHA